MEIHESYESLMQLLNDRTSALFFSLAYRSKIGETISDISKQNLFNKHILGYRCFTRLFQHRNPTGRGPYYMVRFPNPRVWKLGLCEPCEDYKIIKANPNAYSEREYNLARDIHARHVQKANEQRAYLQKHISSSVYIFKFGYNVDRL